MIRLATIKDFDAIIALGRVFLARSSFAYTNVDVKKSLDYLQSFTGKNNRRMLVSEVGGMIVGVLMLVRQSYWWSSAETIVTNDLFIAARAGEGRKLLRRGLQWAWSDPSTKEVILTINSGIGMQGTVRLASRDAFIPHGVSLVQRRAQRKAA